MLGGLAPLGMRLLVLLALPHLLLLLLLLLLPLLLLLAAAARCSCGFCCCCCCYLSCWRPPFQQCFSARRLPRAHARARAPGGPHRR